MSPPRPTGTSSALLLSSDPNDDYSPQDLARLEAQLASTPSSPLQTTYISKARSNNEIKLLSALAGTSTSGEEEEAISNLWRFWFNEAGSSARDRLEESEILMQSRSTWSKAEDVLRDLVGAHPSWAEAKNRLATLLFMKGQIYDSSLLCCQVLRAKPYHFGCLSGAAMCYSRLNDDERVEYYQQRQMPRMGTEERRRWVHGHIERIRGMRR